MKTKTFKEFREDRKRLLKSKPSFSQDLFKGLENSLWPAHTEPMTIEENLSEKSLVLDSLKHFAEDKLSQSLNQQVLVGGGGVIKGKSPVERLVEPNTPVLTANELRAYCEQALGKGSAQARYQETMHSEITYMFVSDQFDLEPADKDIELNFLSKISRHFFKGGALTLFTKMAAAMKQNEDQVALSSFYNGEQNLTALFHRELLYFKPKILITLGAKATAEVLKERKRIAEVHGQLFPRELTENSTVKIMPLFHPEFLFANPDMKKAAWVDIQKAMSLL